MSDVKAAPIALPTTKDWKVDDLVKTTKFHVVVPEVGGDFEIARVGMVNLLQTAACRQPGVL